MDASLNSAPCFQMFLEEADADNTARLDDRLGDADGYTSGPLKQGFNDEI